MPHDNILYRIEKAESTLLENTSVDLITIAQALHWFEWDAFYSEVKRVLKEGGKIAAWTYGLPTISEEVDAIVRHLHDHILDPYWQYENRLVEKEYTTLPFPFQAIASPDFYTRKRIPFEALIGLLYSWSAVQRYMAKNGSDPIQPLEKDLRNAWGHPQETKEACWKLILKVGEKYPPAF